MSLTLLYAIAAWFNLHALLAKGSRQYDVHYFSEDNRQYAIAVNIICIIMHNSYTYIRTLCLAIYSNNACNTRNCN